MIGLFLDWWRRWWLLNGPMGTIMRPGDRIACSRNIGHWPSERELDTWILKERAKA